MDRMLEPYIRVRLCPVQEVYVKRIWRVTHYLRSKNPFAVKWKDVRKDAMETEKLFEECMYLLDNDIRDPGTLKSAYKAAGRKERNLIRRIMEMEYGECGMTREVSRTSGQPSE